VGRTQKGSQGFTLIELMIVVAIIGILAAIAIPRFGQMLEKSKEGQTKGNLNSIHSAASIYYSDQKGIWPTTLSANPSYSFSMYLDYLGPVKASGYYVPGAVSPTGAVVAMTTNGGTPNSSATGWLYDSTNGSMYVNSTVKDSRAVPYSFYGFE